MSYWKRNENYISSFYVGDEGSLDFLIGQSITEANTENGEMVLSDGTRLMFDQDASDCCSYQELTKLSTCPNIITGVKVEDNEDETGGEGEYRAWINVLTEAGEFTIAEADGDASNGYYLHGWSLGVEVIKP